MGANSSIVGCVSGAKTGYDIVLLAGQSNMAGRGTFTAGIDTTDINVFQYDGFAASGTYRTIVQGVDPLKHPEGSVLPTAVGPGMFFAKAHVAATGRKVLLVPAAWGGTSLAAGVITWNPTGRDYLNAIDQSNRAITAAVAQYPGSRFVGILWFQGEGDGSNNATQSQYETAFINLISGLRAGITGAANSWFIASHLVPEAVATHGGGSGTYAQVDAALNIVTSVARGGIISARSGFCTDNLHYNAAGARLCGSDFAAMVPTAQANTGDAAPGQVTALAAGTITSNSIPLTWTAPASGGPVRDYEVQFALAGSGSWTTVSDGVSTTTSATVPGLSPSTSYDTRVRAKNYGVDQFGAFSSTLTVSTIASGLTDAFPRLTAITGAKITEYGNGTTGWVYTSALSSAFASDHAGVSSLKMPAGVDGDLRAVFTVNAPNNTQTPILGLVTSQTDPLYSAGASGYKFGIIAHSSGSYRVIVEGGGTSVSAGVTVMSWFTGDIIKLSRSGGTIVAQVARAATPASFTTIYTFASTYTGDLWAAISCANGTSGTYSLTLVGAGWA